MQRSSRRIERVALAATVPVDGLLDPAAALVERVSRQVCADRQRTTWISSTTPTPPTSAILPYGDTSTVTPEGTEPLNVLSLPPRSQASKKDRTYLWTDWATSAAGAVPISSSTACATRG